MPYLLILCLLTGCTGAGLVSDLANDVTEIETKAVVSIEIDKAAFSHDQTLKISIETERQ
jgi:hypothetical protein